MFIISFTISWVYSRIGNISFRILGFPGRIGDIRFGISRFRRRLYDRFRISGFFGDIGLI